MAVNEGMRIRAHDYAFVDNRVGIECLSFSIRKGECPQAHGNINEYALYRDVFPDTNALKHASVMFSASVRSASHRLPNLFPGQLSEDEGCWTNLLNV